MAPMINLYLDVDGVLNPCYEDNPEWSEWTDMSTVAWYGQRFYLHLSTEMGRTLAELPVNIVWLTTWVTDNMCNLVVGRHFAWDEIRCLSDDPPNEKYRWWKLHSILGEENIHTKPFIWIDDDLKFEDEATRMFATRDDALLICPKADLGITKEHIAQIQQFAEKWQHVYT